ncbi:DUF732 domain-containing protein [Mycobacterium parmense]|uniref:Uncharacterized protein n=1 Tax=Mycobacterium parmense TaxID=185642 RepID=A0A7I7Z0W8_9MYCO|nr:DUF732 domain-containing protein [Mycobacterium parmense]ORW52834.1 hypothetical protein AWC20_21230 [Mycobacterium parmense]BBZ46884.1 hypothetical protein MPRM_41650 [Mycobacterium parmense]
MPEPVPAAHENSDETAAANLAWSRGDDAPAASAPAGERQSWRDTWRRAAALFAGGLALAGVIMVAFWLMSPGGPDDRGSSSSPSKGDAAASPSGTPAPTSAPSSIASTPDQDNAYVQKLNDQGISFANPDAAIYNGKLVCQDIDQGMTVPQIVAAFQGSNPSLGQHADTYVTISVHTYCPQHNDMVGTVP